MRKASGDGPRRNRSASVRFADTPSPSRYDARRSEETASEEQMKGDEQQQERSVGS